MLSELRYAKKLEKEKQDVLANETNVLCMFEWLKFLAKNNYGKGLAVVATVDAGSLSWPY